MTHQEMAGKIRIEVIGPGCSFCRDLYRRVGEVVAERGLEAHLIHIRDLKTVLRYIPFTPVLKVDDRIVHRGKRLPEKDKLWDLIRSDARPEEQQANDVSAEGGGNDRSKP